MNDEEVAAPDNTAVRVALWRALHVEVDSPPHVLEDEVGLKLAAPDDAWRSRPDMSPFTWPFRGSIVARARFIEDLVAEQMGYSLDTWTGEVTGFDNKDRTLTLTCTNGKEVLTFVASIPDAPYELGRDLHNFRVVDFPYQKDAKIQIFKYEGPGNAATILPSGAPG